MLTIQNTLDYQKFQLISCNREIKQKHVNKLASDPDFPNNIFYNPIIVNEKMEIIDGQHRFLACIKLGIAVPFIVKPGANLKDVMKVNVNQKPWEGLDFLRFYANQKNSDYVFIQGIKERYVFPLYLVNTICRKFEGKTKEDYMLLFKEGSLKINNKKEILEYCEYFIPKMKELKKFQGQDVRHIFTLPYFEAFVDIYLTKKEKFLKLMNNLVRQYKVLTGSDSIPQCRELILKAADKKWR